VVEEALGPHTERRNAISRKAERKTNERRNTESRLMERRTKVH
jgi:hypothetical protein